MPGADGLRCRANIVIWRAVNEACPTTGEHWSGSHDNSCPAVTGTDCVPFGTETSTWPLKTETRRACRAYKSH